MRVRAAATVAALTILALAGCGASTAHSAAGPASTAGRPAPSAPAPSTPATGAPAGGPSASPTPSAISVADLTRQVDKARIATVAGSRFSAPDRSGLPPLDVC